MISNVFLEVGLVIGIAAVLALIGRGIRQPTIVAYLIAGIIAGPLVLGIINSTDLIKIFAHIGITFLLFVIGLSLDFRVLKQIGKVAIVTGISQFLITAVLGFLIAIKFGFSQIQASFLAIALAVSSTVVVMTLLSEKREIDTLHGKIAIGILIVQDFIAVIALLLLPTFGQGVAFIPAIEQLVKGALLVAVVFAFTYLVIPGILTIAAKNQEVLFLFSVAWALLVASLFYWLGFSIEIGALIAGMSLASSKFSLEISGKIKGIREFFVIIHLVFFGSLLTGPINAQVISSTLIFSALVLIGNPLIIMAILRGFGYKKRTNFLTGLSVAQISEFSLIIVFLGFTSGLIGREILSLTILVALVTITISSFGIHYSQKIFNILSPALNIFDGKGEKSEKLIKLNKEYDIILIGYNRIGFNLVRAFEKAKKSYLIIDYNPKTIEELKDRNIPCVYGDANDSEFLDEIDLNRAKIVISTIPDLDTNLTIMNRFRNKDNPIFMPTSHDIPDTERLYKEGAIYVIMPHFLGGSYVADMFSEGKFNKKELEKEADRQLQELEERLSQGHVHPNRERHEN